MLRRLAAVLAVLWLATLAGAQDDGGRYLQFMRASMPAAPTFVTVLDTSSLLGESLAEADFAACTKWALTGDFACSGGALVYTHATGVGTATQTSANGAIPWSAVGSSGKFMAGPTSGTNTGDVACTVTTVFAAAATTLPTTSGTVVVTAKSGTVGSFVIDCASTSGVMTWPAFSLKQVNGGAVTAYGRVLAARGTIAAPGFGFISVPGTGLTALADGTLIFDVVGTGRFYLDGTQLYPASSDAYSFGTSAALLANIFVARSIQGSKSKSLTDAAAAVSFVRIAVPTNANMGGDVIFTATSTDGASGSLTRQGRVGFAGADIAGTVTCGVSAEYGAATAYSRANTLLCTVTTVTSTTNCDLQVTCTDNKAAAQTVLFNYRLDMPIPNTVTPQ